MIVKNSACKLSLYRTKGKGSAKKNKKGFGLDVPRLRDMLSISRQSGIGYFLAVRHVNNQTYRRLIGYKYIYIKNFADEVTHSDLVAGGKEMRAETSISEILICSYELFGSL